MYAAIRACSWNLSEIVHTVRPRKNIIMSKQILPIFNGRFASLKKLSQGSFGIVYLVEDKETKEQYAMKLERTDTEDQQSLDREVQILEQLRDVVGVPKFIWHGQEHQNNVLVMQLLGRDLAYYFKNQKKFTLKCATQIAYQCVQILRNIHGRYVVHRDLKPENILTSKDGDQIYIVDFGISKIYWDGEHIPFRDDKTFMGTTRYASIAAHKGYELGRKDDLESLFFVIIYFLRGNLPWQNMQVADNDRTRKVGEMKAEMDPAQLCTGFPIEYIQIFEYLRQSRFKEEPDYSYILELLSQVANNNQFVLDGRYDWTFESTSRIIQQRSLDLKNEQSPRGALVKSTSIKDQVLWSVNDGAPNSQQNFLLIPDANRKPGDRNGNRHSSQASSFNSTSKMGSFSSMKIKYIPTVLEIEHPHKLDHSKESEYSNGMDENYEDTSLEIKYTRGVDSVSQYFLKIQKFKNCHIESQQ